MTTTTQATPDHPRDNPDMHVSFNDWLDYMAEEFPTIDAMRFYETREIVDKVEPEPEAEPEATNYMGDDWQPDYSKTAEYGGAGITADLTPADSLVGAGVEEVMAYGEANGWNPALLGILAAISTKGKSLGKKGLFTPRKNKGNQLTDKRGTKSGEIVGDSTKGGPGVAVGKPGPASQVPSKHVKYPIVPRKIDETRRLGLTRANELKTAAGLTTALAANRMLQGDRDVDGTLKVATKPEVITPDVEPDGVEETRPGWLMKEGQNFWTVNNDSDHWNTDEGIAEGIEVWGEPLNGQEAPQEKFDSDYWFKQEPQTQQKPTQELDWDFWFKQ